MSEYVPTNRELAVLKALKRFADKDEQKGGLGLRTVAEVAEYTSLQKTSVRSALNRLEDAGLADGYDDRPLIWGISTAGMHELLARGESQ